MAKFFPEFQKIKNLKQAPTAGELHALNVLKDLSDDYEVYFQPFIHGNNPDIIVVRKNYGVLIIEVKGWQLAHYRIEENDNWILRQGSIRIKSPIEQVKAYKNGLYDLSVPYLLQRKIENVKCYGLIKTAVYFHAETAESIKENNIKADKFCPVYGNDNFSVKSILKYPNKLFDNAIYQEFCRVLKPSLHALEQAQKVRLTKKQELLAKSESKEQKIRGVAGSGKTLLLAQRAVNSHIRHGGKVLILTYNITLRNYIHDHLKRVSEEFKWSNFHIIHYDAFVFSEANNHNIKDVQKDDINLFEQVKNGIAKYQAIFIDEVQDYQEEWIRIIKKYFLVDGGEFVVFGDEKQNVYNTKLDEDKKPNTTIVGRWTNLDQSFRLNNKILQLAEDFQSKYFREKYELDKAIPKQQELASTEAGIEYYKFNDDDTIVDLSKFILGKIKKNTILPQDVCIIAHANQLLREVDFEIRKDTKQKTYTTFETQERYNDLKIKFGDKSNEKYNLENTIKTIRRNKRFNFLMNSEGIKLSTVHSFKGLEINTLFLIIDNKSSHETSEIIYTALTRCRNTLFILNINNDKYDEFFNEKIQPGVVKAEKPTPRKKTQENSNQKTIGAAIKEDQISKIFYNFSQLNVSGKFNMLVLGKISETQNEFKKSLNDYFEKNSIKSQAWNLEFWNNEKIKKQDIRSLKKGQSKYNLLITGQIHQHSSKGNKQGNLLSELMKPEYVKRIYGSNPKKILTVDDFINKIDEYISKFT